MKIAIANDHRGYQTKLKIKWYISQIRIRVDNNRHHHDHPALRSSTLTSMFQKY